MSLLLRSYGLYFSTFKQPEVEDGFDTIFKMDKKNPEKELLEISGLVPFVATHFKGRFFVFFTVGFLLFLDSNPAGPLPNSVGQSPNPI